MGSGRTATARGRISSDRCSTTGTRPTAPSGSASRISAFTSPTSPSCAAPTTAGVAPSCARAGRTSRRAARRSTAWRHNYQWRLTIKRETRLTIQLSVPDSRHTSGAADAYTQPIGFALLRGNDGDAAMQARARTPPEPPPPSDAAPLSPPPPSPQARRKLVIHDGDVLDGHEPRIARRVSKELTLAPMDVPYVLLPYCHAPGAESLFSDDPLGRPRRRRRARLRVRPRPPAAVGLVHRADRRAVGRRHRRRAAAAAAALRVGAGGGAAVRIRRDARRVDRHARRGGAAGGAELPAGRPPRRRIRDAHGGPRRARRRVDTRHPRRRVDAAGRPFVADGHAAAAAAYQYAVTLYSDAPFEFGGEGDGGAPAAAARRRAPTGCVPATSTARAPTSARSTRCSRRWSGWARSWTSASPSSTRCSRERGGGRAEGGARGTMWTDNIK